MSQYIDNAGLDKENYFFKSSANGNEDLIIAFLNKTSSVDYEGQDAFTETECNLLIVNSEYIPWQGAALDDLLAVIPAAQKVIQQFIDLIKPARIYVFGFSLSAFPAILMGAAFGADRIVALGPETKIGLDGSRSARHLRGEPTRFETPDLYEVVKERGVKDLCIIAGEEDAIDLYNAYRMNGIPNVSLFSVRSIDHQVFAWLRAKKLTLPLLTESKREFFGKDLGIKWGSLINNVIIVEWFRGLTALRAKRYPEAVERLENVLKEIPKSRVVPKHLAEAYLRNHQFQDAVDLYRIIAKAQPNDKKISNGLLQAEEKLNKSQAKTGNKRSDKPDAETSKTVSSYYEKLIKKVDNALSEDKLALAIRYLQDARDAGISAGKLAKYDRLFNRRIAQAIRDALQSENVLLAKRHIRTAKTANIEAEKIQNYDNLVVQYFLDKIETALQEEENDVARKYLRDAVKAGVSKVRLGRHDRLIRRSRRASHQSESSTATEI
ncbi:tetratricopeptide repeat protein (plasmid) [Methylobacterium sp. CM6241]